LLLLVVSLLAAHDGMPRDSGSHSAAAPAQDNNTAARELTPNQPITQLLSREAPHTYRIDLLPGQYVSILVTKGDVNLQLTVAEPGGQTLREFVSWRYGPLRASFIAAAQGTYLVEARSLESEAAGREYVLLVEEVRAATDQDRKDDGAVKAYAEAERLRAEWKEESSQAAIVRYTEASAYWQATGRPREASGALLDAGDTFFALSKYRSALDLYNRALKLRRGTGDQRGVMQALNSIGYVYANTDNNERALLHFRRVLNFYSRIRLVSRSVEDLRSTAQANNNLGEVYYYRGDLLKAKEYFNRALEMHAEAGDRRGQALAHLNLGYIYSDSGDLHNSMAHLSLSLTLWRAVNDIRGEALSDTVRGMVLSFQGESQNAFNAYKKALQLFRTIGDRQGEAAALNSIGKSYEDLNEPQIALDHYTLALKLFQQSVNPDAEAVTRYYIGRAYRSLKDDVQALESYGRCLSLSRALGKRRIEHYALVDIASIQASRGQQKQALDGYEKALRFYRNLKDRRGQAHVLNSIGDIYFSSADRRKALSLYRQALTLSRDAGDQRGEASMLYKVARAERDDGDLEQALTDIKAALQISESQRTKVARQDLRSSFFASVNDQYVLYIDLLMRMHERHPSENFAATALQASESARARTLLETLANADLDVRRGVAPELLEHERVLQQSLAAKAESHVLLRAAGGYDKEAGELEAETRRLTTQYQEVQAEVREQGLRNATLVQSLPLRLDEIQTELLDHDTLLLEYALGEEASYLWAVTPTSLSSYKLPPRSEIEGVAREVYRLLTASQEEGRGTSAGGAGRADSLDAQYWQAASAMSKMLLKDVASQLGRKRLLIVADGALQYIPFEALPVPVASTADAGRGGGDDGRLPVPLVVEHEIVSLPSASTLVALRRRGKRPESAPGKLVVVLADPVFEPDDPRFQSPGSTIQTGQAEHVEAVQLRASLRDVGEAGRNSTLSRLPFTLQEAKAIMAVAPADGRTMVTGFGASRSLAVGGGLSGYRVVHFATHGVINCQHPELSGIVLSMLNERGERENGFLQLHDIYRLDLSADLVVLSACSTGLGEEIRGEGLVGLTQGFLHTGANTVVASLWRVDDRATAELMQHFYQAMLEEGLTPAAALRDAKKALWREKRWHSPYYWAAFVLQGEYQQSIKPDAGQSNLPLKAFAIIILLTALFVIAAWRERAKRRRSNAP
jgi:CHAT domain-containing protein/predicted negative regulator of RcsB-dependent stress response